MTKKRRQTLLVYPFAVFLLSAAHKGIPRQDRRMSFLFEIQG
ncbi:hypothetical protein [Brevibacillus borstelensis]|nr:hypothetical protein [Brevibacillus borstelensis]WNF04070.1 hypothetical protein RFB14_16845 [Brevibacillus borstelensis]